MIEFIRNILNGIGTLPDWTFKVVIFGWVITLSIIFFLLQVATIIIFKGIFKILKGIREVILPDILIKPSKAVQRELDDIKNEMSDIKKYFTTTIMVIGIIVGLGISLIGILVALRK